MIPKSSAAGFFYRLTGPPDGARQRVESAPTTAGPWSLAAQHGGPPAALLGRAIEGLDAGVVGRFTMDLLGPVPVGELEVSASVVRPGRSVSLAHASLHDVTLDRPVATVSALAVPTDRDRPPGRPGRLLLTGRRTEGTRDAPRAGARGYLDAVEWRWITGGVDVPGPGVVWMRPPALVEGEAISTPAAPAGVRGLGVRGQRDARRPGVGLPEHRADRAPAPGAGG